MLDLFANPRFYIYDSCCPYCGKISPSNSYGQDSKGVIWEKCSFCKARDGEHVDKNTTALSVDIAKFEETRRREYEKVEQVNAMYKAAKALGFPEQVSLELKDSYYVIVSVPNCFNSKNVVSMNYDIPRSFIRLRLDAGSINIHDQFLSEDEPDIPNFVLWLLVCMKFFYRKDWDGRKWIDEKEGFTKYEKSFTTYSEASQVSNLNVEVMKKLSEQLAYDIDNEIMKAIVKDPENWKVQAGNIAYGSGSKVSVMNEPLIKIKPYEV